MYVVFIGWLKKVALIERLYVHQYYYTLFYFKVSYYKNITKKAKYLLILNILYDVKVKDAKMNVSDDLSRITGGL